LISRQFVQASQRYKTYQFVITDFCDNNKFNLKLVRYCCGGTLSKDFQLTLEEIQRRNQLLNVQYVDIIYYSQRHADEYLAVSRIFSGLPSILTFNINTFLGHIALGLACDRIENEFHHCKIIKQLQSQLYSLRCHINSLLVTSEDVPRLNLIYCACTKIENFCKFL
jgi:hypothetical protein